MKLSDLECSAEIDREGKWFDANLVSALWGDENVRFRLKIAPYANPYHAEWMRKVARRRIETMIDPNDPGVDAEGVAKHVLKDWEDVEDENGPLKYTPAIGERVLKDERYWRLFNVVRLIAQDSSNFSETHDLPEPEKNCSTTSDGS